MKYIIFSETQNKLVHLFHKVNEEFRDEIQKVARPELKTILNDGREFRFFKDVDRARGLSPDMIIVDDFADVDENNLLALANGQYEKILYIDYEGIIDELRTT